MTAGARPHYRLRVILWHTGQLLWCVQHVAGCRRDRIIYSTDWYPQPGQAVRAAAEIPNPPA